MLEDDLLELKTSFSVFFYQKEYSSKAIYFLIYVVLSSLWLANIKQKYRIKSACKFTKIGLFHRLFIWKCYQY